MSTLHSSQHNQLHQRGRVNKTGQAEHSSLETLLFLLQPELKAAASGGINEP